jgi:hypothetical protein
LDAAESAKLAMEYRGELKVLPAPDTVAAADAGEGVTSQSLSKWNAHAY